MTKCLVSYNSRGRKEDADNKKEKKRSLEFYTCAPYKGNHPIRNFSGGND